MNIYELSEGCSNLERVIDQIVRHNEKLSLELKNLQLQLIDDRNKGNSELSEIGIKLSNDVAELKKTKLELEEKSREYSETNNKLSCLFEVKLEEKNTVKQDEPYFEIMEAVSDYEQTIFDFNDNKSKLMLKIETLKKLDDKIPHLSSKFDELREKIISNDQMISIMDKQYRIAEQQFDLILNNLPWEPISDKSMDELKSSNNEAVRNLASIIQNQADEIIDLNGSLTHKSRKKLEFLDKLASNLDQFAKTREQAKTLN